MSDKDKPGPPIRLIKSVDETIITFSPLEFDDLKDGQKLEDDCRLYQFQRRALASPFQKIAMRHASPGARPRVTGVACEKLKTVKTARALVALEAGYGYKGGDR